MAINQLSTANTFEEWLTTTASLVAVANNLTDNTNGGFVANSSIYIQGSAASLNVRTLANINTLQANTANIANVLVDSSNVSIPLDLIVGRNANVIGNVASVNVTNRLFVGGDSFIYGNLTISGNVTLDAVGFDDLDVKGSANIANSLNVSGTSYFSNISTANVTSNLHVGGDTFLYGNLTISGNVTLDSIGFDDLSVAGSVNSTNLNTSTANITLLTGTSNTSIYSTITAAIDSSIAFAIALG